MSRYIDADELRKVLDDGYTKHFLSSAELVYVDQMIDNAPTADVREVVQGEWKALPEGIIACSRCGMSAPKIMSGCLINRHLEQIKTNYCPNCGARMEVTR